MQKSVIILSGRATSGKTFAMNYIKSIYDDSRLVTFAAPLKRMCVDILGLNALSCYGSNHEKDQVTHIKWADLPIDKSIKDTITKSDPIYMTGREVMEVLGTQIFRKMYYDCWVKAACHSIIADDSPLFIIEDCRFPNEIDYLRNNLKNVYVIRLTRNPLNRDSESERALDNYDFTQENMFILDNKDMSLSEKNIHISDIVKDIINYGR